MLATSLVPLCEMGQLYPKHCRLDRIESPVPSKLLVVVAAGTTVVTQAPHVLGHFGTRGGDDAGVSVGAKVFRGIKTEGRSHTERSRWSSAPLGPDRLCGVFDNRHFKFLSEAREGIHVRALAVEMNGQNGANGLVSKTLQPMRDSMRIKIEGPDIDVDEYRRGAHPHNRTGRRKEAERRSDHRISRLHAGCHQRQPQRFGSRGAPDRSRGSGLSRDLPFERLNLRAENEDLRVAHARNGRQHLLADALVLTAQVEERDRS